MVLTFDEVGERLDAMAEEFPPVFYRELNGGISLLPESVEDPEFPPGEIYIMGEYCDDQMGRYIQLYYGSFAALAEKEDWTVEAWDEGLAQEFGLDRKDEEELAAFRAYYKERHPRKRGS